MMFTARNLNRLAPQVYRYLQHHGVAESSRNGPVVRAPAPVTIEITHPHEVVCASEERDCNPFFHLTEALLMLSPGAVKDHVVFLSAFATGMKNYSDNGSTYNAFYGDRARKWRGDQLGAAIEILGKDPASRQAVVQLWDPEDLLKLTRDKACNLCLIFRMNALNGTLEMITFNRSNDAVFGGVTGANMVHLPMFQSYVADALGWQVGTWWHTSANLHTYTDNPKLQAVQGGRFWDDYENTWHLPRAGSLFTLGDVVGFDTRNFRTLHAVNEWILGHDGLDWSGCHGNRFLSGTFIPMMEAFRLYKLSRTPGEPTRKDLTDAIVAAGKIERPDWRYASITWLNRRNQSTNES